MNWKRKYEEIPLLFHGTNKDYFEQTLEQFGRYEHIDKTGDREYVHLTLLLEDGIDYALRRSIGRNTQGTLLLIQTSLVLPRLEKVFFRRPVVKYLNKNEFIPYHLSKRSEKIVLPIDVEEIAKICKERMNIVL
ncbi:hypothetical protein KAT80_02575 [Candidatus Pacearchaeota archaeon]|nr:hypothetical protein [Candidatus Pacearchaeota archaeon]